MPQHTIHLPRIPRTFDPALPARNRSIGEHYANKQEDSVGRPVRASREPIEAGNPRVEIEPMPIGAPVGRLPPVPDARGKMFFLLTAMQLIGPAIAHAFPSARASDATPATGRVPLTGADTIPPFTENSRVFPRAVLALPAAERGKEAAGQSDVKKVHHTHHGQSGQTARSHHVGSTPKHVATAIGTWPTRRDVARQIMVDNGLNPDEYRVTQTVNAPGRTALVFPSYTNDTLLDQYLRSQLTTLGVVGNTSDGLTHLPDLDQAYEKAWADFAATKLPEIRREVAQKIVELFSSSFGVSSKREAVTVYQANSNLGASESGYFVRFPHLGKAIAIWESKGDLHMEKVPNIVFADLISGRATGSWTGKWVKDHIGHFFSEEARDNGSNEDLTARSVTGAISPLKAATIVATNLLDPERLETAGYEETAFERFIQAARSALIPYYDAAQKATKGDLIGAGKSAAEETFYDVLFSVTARAVGKAFAKGLKAIGKTDIASFRRTVDRAIEELHLPKANEFGENVKTLCKRDFSGCSSKPNALRLQKHAAKKANRHHLTRPAKDPAAWARSLTTTRVADLFGNSLNPDGSYRLTAEKALAGLDNHLQQVQQEINSAVAVFTKWGATAKQEKEFLQWVANAIISAAKDARFNFGPKEIQFGPDMGWLKFKRQNGHVTVLSRPCG